MAFASSPLGSNSSFECNKGPELELGARGGDGCGADECGGESLESPQAVSPRVRKMMMQTIGFTPAEVLAIAKVSTLEWST